MASHKFEYDARCKSCKGTGLYVGEAERDGAAVVCWACKGVGRVHHVIEWDDPPIDGPIPRGDVCWVVEKNIAQVVIGEGGGFTFADFGGMPYIDWLAGKPFPPGSEMRNFVCPWWRYQSGGPSPSWCVAHLGMSFKNCPRFASKDMCWTLWDQDQEGKLDE